VASYVLKWKSANSDRLIRPHEMTSSISCGNCGVVGRSDFADRSAVDCHRAHGRDPAISLVGNPRAVGIDDRLYAISHAELEEDARDIRLRCLSGDDEGGRDLDVRHPLCK
jgi:hypothetical protein